MNASGVRSRIEAKRGQNISTIPSSSSRSKRSRKQVRRAGGAPGLKNSVGIGSKEHTVETPPYFRAMSFVCASISWCPRCNPSKTPIATVRGFAGPSERGIGIEPVRVLSYVENHDALDRLGRLVAEGRLTLRVAETFPPERAAEAQQKLAAGGIRGRLLIVF